jgi:hypothetical protein
MTLETALKDVGAKWELLHDRLTEDLLWSITQTMPGEQHALATHYVDAATDLIGEVNTALSDVRAAISEGANLGQTAQALARSQERFIRVNEQYSDRMASHTSLRRLRRFGRERKSGWQEWTVQVIKALDRCREPLHDLSRSLLRCLQEVTERVGLASVSVQATNIGQQITVAKDQVELEAAAH